MRTSGLGVATIKIGTESPFMPTQPRFTVGISWMLLVTLVAAASSLLALRALTLPPVIAELSAWFGQTPDPGDNAANRRAQVIFLLLCYSAPLIIGLVTRIVHLSLKRVLARVDQRSQEDDEPFRME